MSIDRNPLDGRDKDTEFLVLEEKPLKIQCVYCERIYKLEEIVFTSKEKKEMKVKQRIQL